MGDAFGLVPFMNKVVLRSRIAAATAAATALLGGLAAAQSAPPEQGEPPYRVECAAAARANEPAPCRTDLATFLGKRVFDAHCAACHARDALGSRYAPALPERMQRLGRAGLLELLERGYGGPSDAVPHWGDVPEVRRYAEALWVYLLARADGVLPPGPVDLLPGAGRP